jgi:penicillin-binding protein 1A
MTVRIANQVGMRKVAANAKRYGVVDSMQPVLAMALGAGETTPFRLTAAYAAFANGGRRIDPYLIESALDRQGKIVWRADKRDCPRCDQPFTGEESPRLAPLGEPVMDPVNAYAITLMLQGVVQNGTAVAVSALGRPLAGKTGTTNDYRSAWFVGYSPDLVVGVFVGFDDNRSLGSGETGSQAAVPIFVEFMREALRDAPRADFKPPKGARLVSVHGRVEAFRPGSEPRGPDLGDSVPRLDAEGKPIKPIPYSALPDGGAPSAPVVAPPPPNRRVTSDLNGLY